MDVIEKRGAVQRKPFRIKQLRTTAHGMALAYPSSPEVRMYVMKEELKLISVEEVAGILQLSRRTLLRMIEERKLPGVKIEGQWKVPEDPFRKWIDEKQNKILTEES